MNETITHVRRLLAEADVPANRSRILVLQIETVRELLALAEPTFTVRRLDVIEEAVEALQGAAFAYGMHNSENHAPIFRKEIKCEVCDKGRLNMDAKRALLMLAIRKEHDGGA